MQTLVYVRWTKLIDFKPWFTTVNPSLSAINLVYRMLTLVLHAIKLVYEWKPYFTTAERSLRTINLVYRMQTQVYVR